MDRVGTLIAERYRVVELLGAGGMGVVVLARDERLNRDVAVKLLPPTFIQDEHARERLFREARAAAALEHPNVVHVYDVGASSDGGAFLVMELVRGKTLRSWATTGRSRLEMVAMVVQAGRALGHAHRAGLVHRDVKPDNMMVRDDGRLVVLDFGLVKPLVREGAADLTAEGAMVGTPAYLAPEQAHGERVSGQADQFALAVVAYELLTGHIPWKATSALGVVAEILRDHPDPPSAVAPTLPLSVDAVLLRALSKAPADRYQDIDAFVSALEAIAGTWGLLEVAPIGAPAAPSAWESGLEKTSIRRAPPPTSSRAIKLASAATLGAVIIAAGVHWVARPAGSAPIAPAPSSEAIGPKALTDAPPPVSSSTEALADYAEGLQAERDGQIGRGLGLFEKASRSDPRLGAAHLRIALLESVYGTSKARSHFNAARSAQGSLSPRDVDLLDAVSPLFLRDPPDADACAARFDALAAKRPDDAEIQFQRGEVANAMGDFRLSIAAMQRSLEADPSFGYAWIRKGEMEIYAGDRAAARDSAVSCRRLAPLSVRCPPDPDDLTTAGCSRAEASIRESIAAAPSASSFQLLAGVLASKGAPHEAMAEALSQAAARTDDAADRRLLVLRTTAELAAFSGDFATAIKSATELERALEASDDLGEHSAAVRLVVGAMQEAGDSRIGETANAFLTRRDAWQAPPWPDDGSLAHDATGEMLAVVHRAGLISDAEYGSRLTQWSDGWKARLRGGYRSYLWFSAYGATAATPAEVTRALALRESFGPLGTYFPNVGVDGELLLGRTLALAGRGAEAIQPLTIAAAKCLALRWPFEATWSRYFLGRAREDTGDIAGACANYADVVARWGGARPRSITAEQAHARLLALRCPGQNIP